MEQNNREKILHKFKENPSWSFSMIGKSLKISPSTVRDVINRFNATLSIDRTKGSGAKMGPRNKKLVSKVVQSVKANPGLSDSERARKLGTCVSTARRMRLYAGLKSYHVVKVPNRTEKQQSTCKTRSILLYDKVLTKFNGCLLMDDETFIKMDTNQLPGQKFYIASKRLNAPEKFKFIKMSKFAKKVMVWQAICSCGMKSSPFITSLTMNTNLYIKECLQKRLLPLIRKHKAPVKFWPDLATCHYSKATINWYQNSKVDFVPVSMNPPNCPEFRPIERYWAIMKSKVKKTGRTFKNHKQVHRTWNKCAKKLSQSDVQKLMAPIKGKVRDFIRNL